MYECLCNMCVRVFVCLFVFLRHQPSKPVGAFLRRKPAISLGRGVRQGRPQSRPVLVLTGADQDLQSDRHDCVVVKAYGGLAQQTLLDSPWENDHKGGGESCEK
jgi:hypothetical protein